jgi:hypothetical protein
MTDPSAPHHRAHHLRRPTGELSHEERISRQRFHLDLACGALLLVLALCAYSAIFDLNSWAEWVVFGGICATVIGFIIAVSSERRS